MNIRVFYKIAENLSGPRISTETLRDTKSELLALKEELGKLLVSKDEPKKEKLENIKRRIARLERFDALENNARKDQKDITEILKWKTADTIKNSDILTLRKKWVDIANLTLVDNANPEREIRSSEIKEKDTFTVNFGNNTSLRDRTGAGDILPPNIRKISINGVDCERKNTPRPGYYNHKWKYEPIYDGYKIEIVALWETTEADTAGNERQWKRERLEDTIENGGKSLTALEEDIELQKIATDEFQSRSKYRSTNFDINDINSWDKGLLDFIAIAEGTWDNYNAIYANGSQSKEKFTEMTLTQILEYQKEYKKWRWSAAIGRYQFMDYTLKDMIKKYSIDQNTIFSAEFQDKLAFLKLNERGLSSFKSWRMPQDDFQLNLAREWASIAKDDSWLSYYHGDSMNNKASRVGTQVTQVLEKLYQA